MEVGRRISANPRLCFVRRVVAKKKGGSDGFLNSMEKLQRCEIYSKRDRAFRMSNSQERFCSVHLVEEYDTHDPKGHSLAILPFLMKRTKVIETVAAHDIVFTLAHSGVCAAFSRGNNINTVNAQDTNGNPKKSESQDCNGGGSPVRLRRPVLNLAVSGKRSRGPMINPSTSTNCREDSADQRCSVCCRQPAG
ncbi:hypothetical protein EV1_045564 [Malus domestica]